jgi:hypothetical protein
MLWWVEPGGGLPSPFSGVRQAPDEGAEPRTAPLAWFRDRVSSNAKRSCSIGHVVSGGS